MFQHVNLLPESLRGKQPSVCGFTLLEVMISLVVLAIGVMGIIGLQASTYRQLQTSQNFSKAMMLASDMADRMLANQGQVAADAYLHDSGDNLTKPSPDCGTEDCTPAQLAVYDNWYWQTELLGVSGDTRVPGSLPEASGEVYRSGNDYIVIVRWNDSLDSDTGAACDALDPEDVQDPDDGLDCYAYALNLGCLDAAGAPCP
jgi:type IV pilus assembly protein PilV